MNNIKFEIFQDRNSLLIFSSQLVSSICEKMMSIGLVWYLTKNYSINIVPWFLAFSFLPHLIFSFFTTKIIGINGPLKTLIYTEFFRGGVLSILFLAMWGFSLSGYNLLVALFISTFLVGIGASLFNPSILSLPSLLVDDSKVVGLNSLIDSSLSLSTILGATFAIYLLSFLELKTVILINALSFFWAGIIQTQLKILNIKKDDSSTSDKGNSSWGVLKKYPDIRRMLVSFLFLNLIFTPILVMIPWYVEKRYNGDASTLAVIEGAMGIGALLTALVLSLTNWQVQNGQRISMIAIVSFLFGLFFVIFASSSFSWQGALILFFIGIVTTFLNIQVLTYFQMSLKPNEIPAIMNAVNIISAASVPFSLGLSGLIFPRVFIPNFAQACGYIILISSFAMPFYLKGSIWKSV